MVMNAQQKHDNTLLTYSYIAAKWDSFHNNSEHHKDIYRQFHSVLPKGKVIELGCGSGNDSEELNKLGYDYTGTDAVAEFVDISKIKYPQRRFVQARAQYIDTVFGIEKFDGFWCSAVLLHIPRDDMKKVLEKLKKLTSPSSVGMISLQKGVGENYEIGNEKTDGLPRLFVYYTKDSFASLLDDTGFKIVYYSERERDDRPDWMHFIVRSK